MEVCRTDGQVSSSKDLHLRITSLEEEEDVLAYRKMYSMVDDEEGR